MHMQIGTYTQTYAHRHTHLADAALPLPQFLVELWKIEIVRRCRTQGR
jgi:hypothetical protein